MRSQPRTSNQRPRTGSARRRARQAAVTLEVILALPVLMIVMLAIVEFGLLLTNLQYVESASRSGALVASRLCIADFNNAAKLENISDAVLLDLSLAAPGITPKQIFLQHNVGGTAVAQSLPITPGGPTNVPYVAITDPPLPASGRYVRVTVFVDFPSIAPNLLASFGLDYKNATVQQTTTYPYYRAP